MAEAGVLQLHREPAEPAVLAEDAVGSFRGRAEESGVTLQVRSAPELAVADVDPVRIGEVLANLLANALNHTPPGGSVLVSVDRADGGMAFSVSDTGSGIPEDQLPHVFDRFVRSADSRGTGLGLAIAKRLVEAHDGTIAAENRPGGGTVVRFVLPRPR